MKLLKLTLTNFKGIKSFEFSPNGKSVSVFGDNGTGKTTLADAQHWLLFGIDSSGTKNFIPKPKNSKEVESGVEATYQTDDCITVTLKKTFSEVWKKKRGQSEAVFSGHKKDHFIDGVPVKESEYNDYINSIAHTDVLKALCSATYFSDILTPENRRKTLFEILGEMTDDAVIASDPELSPLTELLKKNDSSSYSTDEFLKISKSRLSEINAQLKTLPARIDEAQRNITDYNEADIEKELEALYAEKESINSRMSSADESLIAEFKQSAAQVSLELLDAESKHRAECMKLNEETEKKITEALSKKQIAFDMMQKTSGNIIRFKEKIEDLKARREKVTQEYKKVSGETWNGDTICPTCGQPVPENQIEQMKQAFNLNKSKRLTDIIALGKETCSKEMLSETEALLKRDEEESKVLADKLTKLEEEVQLLKSRLITPVPFSTTPEYIRLTALIADYNDKIKLIREDAETANTDLMQELAEVSRKIDDAVNRKAAAIQSSNQKNRVLELEAQMSELSDNYSTQSRNIYLCETFVRAKTKLLTDKINDRFRTVSFQLFENQINGGVKEICETLVLCAGSQLIPYSYANNAARINAGLDIIRVLSEHYGVSMPVFVDNAESVVHLENSGLQVIRLVVSENDKKLRVEEI